MRDLAEKQQHSFIYGLEKLECVIRKAIKFSKQYIIFHLKSKMNLISDSLYKMRYYRLVRLPTSDGPGRVGSGTKPDPNPSSSWVRVGSGRG